MTSINKDDIIVFNYLLGETPTGSDHNDVLLGKVTDIRKDDSGQPLFTVQLCDECQNMLDEKLNVGVEDVLCNLLAMPKAGSVYGKEISKKPYECMAGRHKVFVYIPSIKDYIFDPHPIVDQLDKTLEALEKAKPSMKNLVFEIHIKEGEVNKSSFRDSSKLLLDGTFNLFISFKEFGTITPALNLAFAYCVWYSCSSEAKSNWLKLFSEELFFDKLNSQDFEEKFIEFLTKRQKDLKLDAGDILLCKFLVKEIKRIKCLTFGDLKILCKFEGPGHIRQNVLPQVLNMVKLKDGVRSIPLSNINALKKFSQVVCGYLTSGNCSADYQSTIESFFVTEEI